MRIALVTDKNLETTGGVPSQIALQKSRLEKLSVKFFVFDSKMKLFEKSGEMKKCDVVLIATRDALRKKALRMAKKWKKPVVFEAFWCLPKGAESKTEIDFMNNCDAVVAPTWGFSNELLSLGLKKPISIVPAWLNERELRVKYVPRMVLMGERLRIFWKGEMTKESGILEFLAAVNEIDTEQECEVYVYGSGEKFKDATKFADKHKLRAKFFGEVSRGEIQKRMRDCHIGVYSAVNDAVMPTEILEMKVAGLPLIIRDNRYMEFLPMGGVALTQRKTVVAMAEMIQNFMKMPSAVTEMSAKNVRDKSDVLYAGQAEILYEVFEYLMSVKNTPQRGVKVGR